MGYRVIGQMDEKWQPRRGLEGPFQYANGRVLYYDPREGKYYCPLSDFYLDQEEMATLERY